MKEQRTYFLIRYTLNPAAFPNANPQDIDPAVYDRFYRESEIDKRNKFLANTVNLKTTIMQNGTETEVPIYNHTITTFTIEVPCI